jgi:hypothetical protein
VVPKVVRAIVDAIVMTAAKASLRIRPLSILLSLGRVRCPGRPGFSAAPRLPATMPFSLL